MTARPRNIIGLYVGAVAYGIVRYAVFAPENWAHVPAFLVNKGIAMAAALCFALAFYRQWRDRATPTASDAATWFRAGIFGVFAHVPLILVVMRPGYFKEFHAGERYSFTGEMVFLFGALAVGAIHLLSRTTWTPRQRWGLSLATMLTLFGHTLCMGIARGIVMDQHHGYLPPMWLLSLVGIGLGISYLCRCRPTAEKSE